MVFASFFSFFGGGGGGLEIARRQVSENKFQFVNQHFAIMLGLCDSIYGVSVSVVKIFFEVIKIDVEVGIPFNGLASYFP